MSSLRQGPSELLEMDKDGQKVKVTLSEPHSFGPGSVVQRCDSLSPTVEVIDDAKFPSGVLGWGCEFPAPGVLFTQITFTALSPVGLHATPFIL